MNSIFIHECPYFPSKRFGLGISVLSGPGIPEYLQPWAIILELKLFLDGKLAVLIVEGVFRALGHECGAFAI